jgi:ABC-type multidrug transport system permease subunit
MLFLSGAFYPVNMLPEAIRPLSQALPLTHLTNFLRGDYFYLWVILGWIIGLGGLFYYLFHKLSLTR